MKHLLVTNDYPPKVGGIQNYLWELWRRLPAGSTAVYCTPHPSAARFDADQDYRIERSPEPVLIPYPWLPRRVDRLATGMDADLVVLDPAVPLGVIGPFLAHPYGVVLHGAEVTIPGRLPVTRRLLGRVLRGAEVVVAAGAYPLAEAERCAGRPLRSILVPPGVDTTRFRPLSPGDRATARQRFGLATDALVVSTVNRIVPRKGMDLLVRASAVLAVDYPELRVLIGGRGRQEDHLARLIEQTRAPVTLLGRLDDADVPLLYGASDLMAMLCHERWWGLEQEGFGIVFLEAAAAGIPQVAGRSGGAQEAVVDGETGLVVDDARSIDQVIDALRALLADPRRRHAMGRAARRRAVEMFDYDLLAQRLHEGLQQLGNRSDG